jgi:hypothetical protein
MYTRVVRPTKHSANPDISYVASKQVFEDAVPSDSMLSTTISIDFLSTITYVQFIDRRLHIMAEALLLAEGPDHS